MSDWSEQIEQDLSWRESEIASLKMQAVSASAGSDRQRAILRAIWAMLYAHYEGFCKFCWDLLLDEIEKRNHRRADAIDALIKLSLVGVFRNLRGNTSDSALWEFFRTNLPMHLSESLAFPQRLETRSNLWPNLFQKNNEAVGLTCVAIDQFKDKIGKLVNYRNEIAHGKKLVIKNLDDYKPYEDAAFTIMHDIAIAVVDYLEQRSYLRARPSDPDHQAVSTDPQST